MLPFAIVRKNVQSEEPFTNLVTFLSNNEYLQMIID
jgi:hypothetical protein